MGDLEQARKAMDIALEHMVRSAEHLDGGFVLSVDSKDLIAQMIFHG